jgi:hypothetical protein
VLEAIDDWITLARFEHLDRNDRTTLGNERPSNESAT